MALTTPVRKTARMSAAGSCGRRLLLCSCVFALHVGLGDAWRPLRTELASDGGVQVTSTGDCPGTDQHETLERACVSICA